MQLCKSTLPRSHSSSWARKGQVSLIINRKTRHIQSCTSLAATRKPNHSLMRAKLHPQVMATEAEPSHTQHHECGAECANQHANVGVVTTLYPAARRESIAPKRFALQATCMKDLLPEAPSPLHQPTAGRLGPPCLACGGSRMSISSQLCTPKHLRNQACSAHQAL
jgi:hypothetical protein